MENKQATHKALEESITVLEVQDERTRVQRIEGRRIADQRDLSQGLNSLVRDCLRHEPPRPIELEHAIEMTEDWVMPLAAVFAGGKELQLQGAGAELIAARLKAAGLQHESLRLDEVESLFNRLVYVSEGRPANQEVLVIDARFVASMVILREFMHHLQFSAVALNSGTGF